MTNENYPNIDMEKTGCLLKHRIQQAGYTVKDIQEKLLLSCPQPIYRWYKGKVLPSVNHLYALSNLLHVHMEELLVPQTKYTITFRSPGFYSKYDMLFSMSPGVVEMECANVKIKTGKMYVEHIVMNGARRMLMYCQNMSMP